jgi:lysophospholipase L1-like esterase
MIGGQSHFAGEGGVVAPKPALPSGTVLALRVWGLLYLLAALVFNPFTIALLPPRAAMGSVAARSVVASCEIFAATGALLWALSWLLRLAPPAAPRRPLGQRVVGGLFLLCSSAVLPLLFAELALRPLVPCHLPPKTTTFMKDDVLGWRLRPLSADKCRAGVYAVNAKGLRGPEVPYERTDASAKRILYLGDSVTAGFGLPFEQAYPYGVQRRLEQAGVRVETVDAGVDGYSPWQYDLYLRREGFRYQPDLVVIGFVLNDVTEKFGLVRFGGSGCGVQLEMSYYTFDGWLKQYSASYRTLDALRLRLRRRGDARADAAHQEKMGVQALVSKPESQRVRHAWDVTFHEMESLTEFCRTNSLPVAIVVFPYAFQFENPGASAGPQAAVARFAEARGIPCLDLFPLMEAYRELNKLPTKALFLDNVHPSAYGSDLISGLISDFLLSAPETARALSVAPASVLMPARVSTANYGGTEADDI